MKIKSFVFIWLVALIVSLNAQAYEVWHTPSGKSYDVYSSVKIAKKGKDSAFYIVSYQTNQHLNDMYGLLLEYYDLLAQLYYFHLPEKIRNDQFSVVTLEAFRDIPKSPKAKNPSRRFTKKLSELKTIIKNHKRINPDRLRAFESFNQKKYKEAASFFQKIKNKVPHDYYQTANAYLLQGNRDEAKNQLQAGLKHYPQDITLLNNLAMTTMLKGTFLLEGKYEYDPQQMEAAKKILSEAIKLDTKNWLTKSNMAVLETTVQNFKEAEKLYLEALELSVGSPEVYCQVGHFYHERHNYKQAKRYYKNALEKLRESGRFPADERKKGDFVKYIKDHLKLAEMQKPIP